MNNTLQYNTIQYTQQLQLINRCCQLLKSAIIYNWYAKPLSRVVENFERSIKHFIGVAVARFGEDYQWSDSKETRTRYQCERFTASILTRIYACVHPYLCRRIHHQRSLFCTGKHSYPVRYGIQPPDDIDLALDIHCHLCIYRNNIMIP